LKNFFIIAFLLMFSKLSFAKGETSVYVDLSRVTIDKNIGTSERLNTLVTTYAGMHRGMLRRRLTARVSPAVYNSSIDIYDIHNVSYFFKKCNYSDAIKCGIDNIHWTVVTEVSVGKKLTILSMKMYNEKGALVSTSSIDIWGKIRYKPQWKLTTISEQTMFGNVKKKILEQYPPKIEELPPLITPAHISQTMMLLYLSVK